jgi:F-type H+-transporting ATPase subunit epsilon
MNPERLVLEIITPDGRTLREQDIDVLIFRRKERRFEQGSEVAIFPLHAPTLIRVPVAPLRYRKGGRTDYLVVDGGFVEVKNNQVLVVTPRFEVISPDEQNPERKAHQRAAQWRGEQKEFRKEIVGYLEAVGNCSEQGRNCGESGRWYFLTQGKKGYAV